MLKTDKIRYELLIDLLLIIISTETSDDKDTKARITRLASRIEIWEIKIQEIGVTFA